MASYKHQDTTEHLYAARSMLWKRKKPPPVVPKFSAIAQAPVYPITFSAYGKVDASANLTHSFVVRRLTAGISYRSRPGGLIARHILAEERRWEDRKHWERFLESPPTHSVQLSYTIDSDPTISRELVHCWVNFAVPGWSANAIAIECGEFLVFSANEMKLPGVLTVRNVGSASSWLIFLFARYRAILVKAGIAAERKPPDHVTGYRLTGDR